MANRATPTNQQSYAASSVESNPHGILDKRHLQDLVKEVDPTEQLDEDVEEVIPFQLCLSMRDQFLNIPEKIDNRGFRIKVLVEGCKSGLQLQMVCPVFHFKGLDIYYQRGGWVESRGVYENYLRYGGGVRKILYSQ